MDVCRRGSVGYDDRVGATADVRDKAGVSGRARSSDTLLRSRALSFPGMGCCCSRGSKPHGSVVTRPLVDLLSPIGLSQLPRMLVFGVCVDHSFGRFRRGERGDNAGTEQGHSACPVNEGDKKMSTKKRRWMGGAVFPVAALAAVAFAAFAGAATQVAPVNTTPPTISGTAKVGQTLTAGDGTWSNTPTSYAYQWLRCNGGGNSCVNVANGTQKTYTLVGVDAGNTMRVRVTATNADGSASAQSDQTAAVEAATSSAAPKNTSAPTISGTAEGRSDADGRQRQLVRQPDRLHVCVAALRR